ncbi:MAG TPA: GNAT family N-acetyltransferase [Pyrinomonadaceae bacterium]|nr:GNAT family N-acetyltransferase [Pyrinomonadaceae bacterium]
MTKNKMPAFMPVDDFKIVSATEEDVALILSFIRELAEYERLSDKVSATEDVLREELFGSRPGAEALIGYDKGKPVGFAVFFHNFSTFVGRRGLYLEDLFVKPESRGKGIGRAMLAYLAKLAQERQCGRLEWAVLDWNEPAIKFYQSLGATPMDDWTTFRLSGDELERLARET